MTDRISILYRMSRKAFEIVLRLLLKVTIIGKENFPSPPFIVASNHTSLLDPPLAGIACNKYLVDFIVKQELFEAPVIRHWTRRVRCIGIRRGENPIKGMREALKRIKAGHVLGIFPEGTRSLDGSLQEAKIGTGFLVSKAQVPVVPIYVFGTAEACPKGRGMKIGTPVGVMVGKPIQPEELSIKNLDGKKDYVAISSLVMDRISSLKDSLE